MKRENLCYRSWHVWLDLTGAPVRNWAARCAGVIAWASVGINVSSGSDAFPRIAGWVERASLPDYGVAIEAKLDTGAETVSLHAEDIDVFRNGDELRVHFRLITHRPGGIVFDLPVVREVEIRRHGGAAQIRPLVSLNLCVAGVALPTEVNLIDRTGFEYSLLVGRHFLQSAGLVVDPATTHRLDDRACLLRTP